ncbi:hypothetical protein BH23CHL1_BH23CHL1_16480 [soil metagenome]
MSLPAPQTKEFADRLTTLAMECRDELTQGTQAIQEIELLIRQTEQEVDRLAQRENNQNGRVREVENSLESFSRSEIRDVLVASHEVQMRLFMMRSQTEQLESRRDSIRSQQDKIRILLDLAEINRKQEKQAGEEDRTRMLAGTTGFSNGAELAMHIIQARETERERVAMQLTDGPAQVMANLILRTQILERVAERAPDRLPDEITDLRKLAASSLLDIRRAIFEMRPLMMDELGLVATLRRYSADFSRENGATISVNGPDRDDPIASTIRVALFRLIQQAMVALIKPNTSAKLAVQVRYEDAQLLVRMDGTSTDPNLAQSVAAFANDPYNTGALHLINAHIQTESFAGGHRVSFYLPLTSS